MLFPSPLPSCAVIRSASEASASTVPLMLQTGCLEAGVGGAGGICEAKVGSSAATLTFIPRAHPLH